jgi:hypothetical protein
MGMLVFNRNRKIALGLMLVGWVLAWYTMLLLTNDYVPSSLPLPDANQRLSLGIGVLITLLMWLNRCFTVQVR